MKHTNIKRAVAVMSAMIVTLSAAAGFPLSAEAEGDGMKTDNMTLALAPGTGKVDSLILNGTEMKAEGASGFVITDCGNDKAYDFTAAVSGSDKLTQSGDIGDSGMKLAVTYSKQGNAVRVDGVITDTTGRDRFVRVKYLLPVKSDGMYWYSDVSDRVAVTPNGQFCTVTENGLAGHDTSVYPYGTVSNGKQAVAMAVPMDPPLASLISYDTTENQQSMTMRFDFAVTPKTSKSVSKAAFSFLIYAPESPEWGFRSATQGYYDLFPEYFEVKSQGGGNWLFQHAYDKLEGVEDFSFGYNETPGSYKYDEQNGVTSAKYTNVAEQWMRWPGQDKENEPTYDQYMQRFNTLLNDTSGAIDASFPGVTLSEASQAIKNSAIILENGKYLTSGWYVYDETVCFTTNHNPDIAGKNSYQLQIGLIEQAEKAATDEGCRLGGVYIDNLAGLGTYNYREEHFASADTPLLWDKAKRLVLPVFSSMYSYTKAIRNRCDENKQIIMANMVFPERGSIPYVSMIDAPGSEMGPHWGWDPYIQRLRRTLAYRKPWMLLLGHDLNSVTTSASSCPVSIKENIMKSAVAYGLYANVIGYRVEMKEYESSRPLFRKYTPIVDIEDKLGWCPVTYAASDGTGIDTERFGELSSGAAIITNYNIGENDFGGKITVDLKALGVPEKRVKELIAFELVGNTLVAAETDAKNGSLSYSLSLEKNDVSAVIIGTRDELWELLYEKINSNLTRALKAFDEIPEELESIVDTVPSQWEELSKHMETLRKLNTGSKKLLKSSAGLITELNAVVSTATDARKEMLNCKDIMKINIIDICGDSLSVASGFTGKAAKTGSSGGLSLNDAVIIGAAAVAALAALGMTFLVIKKKRGSR